MTSRRRDVLSRSPAPRGYQKRRGAVEDGGTGRGKCLKRLSVAPGHRATFCQEPSHQHLAGLDLREEQATRCPHLATAAPGAQGEKKKKKSNADVD